MATLAYTIAAALMLLTAGAARAPLVALDTSEALIVAYAAIAACFVAYSLMAYSLLFISPSEVALYGALQPPLTALFAFLATGEKLPSARDIGGGGLAIFGLVCVALTEDAEAKDQPVLSINNTNPLLGPGSSPGSNASASLLQSPSSGSSASVRSPSRTTDSCEDCD